MDNKMQIEITNKCNFSCYDCGAFCNQAPSNDFISIDQIKKFIKQSKKNKIKWEHVILMGGEPTLHSNFNEIVELIYESGYCKKLSINTNGYSILTRDKLNKIKKYPKNVGFYTITKNYKSNYFRKINIAPLDLNINEDFSKGCWALKGCGLGLNINGYYPCLSSSSIDRIIGLDLGVKDLKNLDKNIPMICDKLCRYCGNFYHNGTEDELELTTENHQSKFWINAFEKWKQNKPIMTNF
jgi:Radical SAM superfamily/4Fe-4S single cluster domain